MKNLVKLIREEPNLLCKASLAVQGAELSTLEALANGYLLAQHLSANEIWLLVKNGFLPQAALNDTGDRPERVRNILAEPLCQEFLRAVDRRDGEAIMSLGFFLAREQEGAADRTRAALLFLKIFYHPLTAKRCAEAIGYKGEISNLYKIAAEAGYEFAPGRPGRPPKPYTDGGRSQS